MGDANSSLQQPGETSATVLSAGAVISFERRSFTLSSQPEEGEKTDGLFNDYRGSGPPSIELGTLGDTYIDVFASTLYARCVGGWTIWPDPTQRSKLLPHPSHAGFYLWCSTAEKKVSWFRQMKMKKISVSASAVVSQIIAAEERKKRRSLKRKADDVAQEGEIHAKKARAGDDATEDEMSAPSAPVALAWRRCQPNPSSPPSAAPTAIPRMDVTARLPPNLIPIRNLAAFSAPPRQIEPQKQKEMLKATPIIANYIFASRLNISSAMNHAVAQINTSPADLSGAMAAESPAVQAVDTVVTEKQSVRPPSRSTSAASLIRTNVSLVSPTIPPPSARPVASSTSDSDSPPPVPSRPQVTPLTLSSSLATFPPSAQNATSPPSLATFPPSAQNVAFPPSARNLPRAPAAGVPSSSPGHREVSSAPSVNNMAAPATAASRITNGASPSPVGNTNTNIPTVIDHYALSKSRQQIRPHDESSLRAALAYARAALSKEKDNTASQKALLAGRDIELARQSKMLAELAAVRNALVASNTAVQMQNGALKNRNDDLVSQLHIWKDSLAGYKHAMTRTITALEESSKGLVNQKERLERSNDQLTAENSMLRAKEAELLRKISAMADSIRQLESENASLKMGGAHGNRADSPMAEDAAKDNDAGPVLQRGGDASEIMQHEENITESQMVVVKPEPRSESSISIPVAFSQKGGDTEVIDLTLDSDDECDVDIPSSPPKNARAYAAEKPKTPAQEPNGHTALNSDGQHITVGSKSSDLYPPQASTQKRDTISASHGAIPALNMVQPSILDSAPISHQPCVVKPVPGLLDRFTIADSEFETARFVELVVQNGGGPNATDSTWKNIVKQLLTPQAQNLSNSLRIQSWEETVMALKDFYTVHILHSNMNIQDSNMQNNSQLGSAASTPASRTEKSPEPQAGQATSQSVLHPVVRELQPINISLQFEAPPEIPRSQTPGLLEKASPVQMPNVHGKDVAEARVGPVSVSVTENTKMGSITNSCMSSPESTSQTPDPVSPTTRDNSRTGDETTDTDEPMPLRKTNELKDAILLSAPGRLTQAQIEILWTYCEGDPFIDCNVCRADGKRYKIGLNTTLEELAEHSEVEHRRVSEIILSQTLGMSCAEAQEWWKKYDH
ncbi:hypothetical protein C8R44DRAFT_990815 [Mycena epipterygia]|nr:hypothetical protein C8R44DRAFT_990815 [Mycena epipterygia]